MRIRQHVNPNLTFFEVFRGIVPPFAPGVPVEVEIGCADAQFLFERAAIDPGRLYVGLEIREDFVDIVNKRAHLAGAPVPGVFCHAQHHTAEIFGKHRAARVFVNFPDPWFKRRHRDRRMVDRELGLQIAAITAPGADIFVQTDVWDIALDALAVFEGLDAYFENRAGAWSFWKGGNPYGVRSWREQHAEETGLPVWRIMYARRGTN